MNLCKYQNIFGEPGKGVHAYRLFDIAIIDVLFTIIFIFIIYMVTSQKDYKKLIYIILSIFGIGIIAHRVFCVRTTVDKLLFPNS